MAGDDGTERTPEQRPDPADVAARSMTQLAQQMREMAERMLSSGLPGRPVGGGFGQSGTGQSGAGRADSSGGAGGQARTGTRGADAGSGGGPAVPGLPAIPGMPPIPGMPATPATMSARQLQAVVDDIAARRSQVRALVAQLEAFDEQLGTLETSLRPLLQWLRTWADMEGAVTDFWTPRPPRS
jgi:hypothetical protein